MEDANGTRSWFVEGKRHRLDGPAIEGADGTRRWYVEGKRHRLDGPALEWADGTRRWYVEGAELTEAEWNLQAPAKTIVIDGVEYLLTRKL
jgi:hypothetical protein